MTQRVVALENENNTMKQTIDDLKNENQTMKEQLARLMAWATSQGMK